MKASSLFFDRSYGYSRAILALIMGIVLIIWPDTAVRTIVIVIGTVIMLLGALSMIFSREPKDGQSRSLLSINGIVSLIFGLVLILFPTFFVGIIMFLFGAILLIVGVSEIASLISAKKVADIPWSLFIGPLITTGCGVVMFFNPFSTIEWVFIFFGISLLIYAITELISTKKIRNIYKDMAARVQEEKLIQDVEYEEVEEK